MKMFLILCGIVLTVCGCSCGEGTDTQQQQKDNETCGGGEQPLNLYKEFRIEITPETPTVGEIVTLKFITVPVDDYSKVDHPWLNWMRNDSPAFSVTMYPYYYRFRIAGACTDSNVISVVSEQKQAKYLIHHTAGGGFAAEVHNLRLNEIGDTVTIKIRMTNQGIYDYIATYRLISPGYYRDIERLMLGMRVKHFVVRAQ